MCETRPNGFSTVWTKRSAEHSITETIISQCHTGSWPVPPYSDRDVGGFMSLHRTWNHYIGTADVNRPLIRGRVALTGMNNYVIGTSPAAEASQSVLNIAGTSAVARVLPTNPNASLATTLGELRKEGLPSLPGASLRDRVDLARKSGHEYLNIQFGWLPLINDLRSFADSVRFSRQLTEQYVRDSGRKIRRRYTFPEVLDVSTQTHTGRTSGLHFAPNSTVTRTVSTNIWFSGAFRYHIPDGEGFLDRLRRFESLTNHLYGTRITPEVVWNLAPWSWALDWFTNAGDVIHNISLLGVDGLVMQYGYVMRHNRVIEDLSGTVTYSDSAGTASYPLLSQFGSEWKQRVRANPYGFGIDDTSLTAKQLSILAALGLTKGQRTF